MRVIKIRNILIGKEKASGEGGFLEAIILLRDNF